jgi:chromosome segregation ATPase
MQLFKKKKEDSGKLFELPELPGFPEMREIKEALKPKEEAIPPLPALPQYPVQAQQLQRPDIKKTEEIGSASAPLTREIMPVQMSRPSYPMQEENEEQARGKQREPIFVKIDKFNDALNNFEAIKQKISEIDSLLKKVKETRTKEQEEIDSWEREVEEIMSKVNNIDQKLFNKLD